MMKWYLNVLDMRGHEGDEEWGSKLSDSTTYGDFETIDEAIAMWHAVCEKMYVDACDEASDAICIGGDMSGVLKENRIVLDFSIVLDPFGHDGVWTIKGEIYYHSSEASEATPSYEWFRDRLTDAINAEFWPSESEEEEEV